MKMQHTQPFPFSSFPLVKTRDLRQAQIAVNGEIAPHRFTCATSADVADTRITCVRLQRTRLFGVHLGSNVLAVAPPCRSLQMIVPISGELVRRCGNKLYRVRPGQGLFSPPDEQVDILWGSHCTGVSIWIEKKPFNVMLNSFFGTTNAADLTYVPMVDLTKGAGLSIAEALISIMVEIGDPETLFSQGITTKQHEELLLTAMVQSAVTLREGTTRCISRKRGGTRLSRALEFIHAHLDEEIRISNVSAAAGVSIRTLQYEFARHLGIGPMTLIRREKLDEVRQELLKSRVGETTIADAAARWGFYDPKYFSKIYLREFHERPSCTLMRTD